jgi:hypothetical protein
MLVNFFARDSLSGALCQEQEHGKLLRLELYQAAVLAQLTTGGIECEGAEANYVRWGS